MSRESKFAILILLLGSALRFHALARDVRFHPDEALFATFARSAAVNGDWLLHGNLDKTPLSIYAVAEAMSLFGVTSLPDGVLTLGIRAGEFAARVPATFASVLSIALMAALGRRLFRRPLYSPNPLIPLVAAVLTAVSPLALSFSATVFTDSLLLMCVMVALWNASRGKSFSAGIWLALAFWCKQQALLSIPLVLMLAWMTEALGHRRKWWTISVLLRVSLPIVIGILLLFVWDAARGQATSLWTLAVANNDPGRLARPDELLPRLLAWAQDAQYLIASGVSSGLVLVLALTGGLASICQRRDPSVRIDIILLSYTLGYLLLHWLIALNIYDRYLLLLLPSVLLLTARGIEWLVDWISTHLTICLQFSAKMGVAGSLLIIAAVFLLLPALDAVEGRFPIGGDHGDYTRIDELGAYLDGKSVGAIIYDHWLGWELGYYIGTWSDKRRVYYPSPHALLADAVIQPDPAPRYFVAPVDQEVAAWLDPLHAAGFTIMRIYQSARFTVYELIPPRQVGFVSNAGSSWLDQIEQYGGSS